jgi:hypothetical protein
MFGQLLPNKNKIATVLHSIVQWTRDAPNRDLNNAQFGWVLRPPEFSGAAPEKALDRSDPMLSFQFSGVPTTSFVYSAAIVTGALCWKHWLLLYVSLIAATSCWNKIVCCKRKLVFYTWPICTLSSLAFKHFEARAASYTFLSTKRVICTFGVIRKS